MTTLSPIPSTLYPKTSLNKGSIYRPSCCLVSKSPQVINFNCKIGDVCRIRLKFWGLRERRSLLGFRVTEGVLMGEKLERKNRSIKVRFNQGFGSNGGGRKGDGITARVLGNIGLAVALTYLSMTGQLGWVLDAIVSLWLLAVIIPIVGVGVFLWWAGRDMIQGTCPNCGNNFRVFKSLTDEIQICPFCAQPFTVTDDEFVSDPVKFSNRSMPFGQPFGDSSPEFVKGKDTSKAVVDIEAEIKDAD